MDRLRWWGSGLLFIAGVIAYYYYAEIAFAWRLLALSLLIIGCLTLVYTTAQGQTLLHLLHESRVEIRKVVWPNRQEVLQGTAVVLLVVFILCCFLWAMDALFSWIISILLG